MDKQEILSKGITILTPSGWSLETKISIRQQLEAAAAEAQAQVVVNLEDIQTLDSEGLTILLDALKLVRSTGGDVHLCSVQRPVRMIFELTRLHKVFNIFPTEQDAVEAFHNSELNTRRLTETVLETKEVRYPSRRC
jgi:anti-sigma B factor antagonist